MSVKYVDDNNDAVKYFGGSDPSDHLELGKVYEVERESVHSWHTRVYLKGYSGEWFNSVHFLDVTD